MWYQRREHAVEIATAKQRGQLTRRGSLTGERASRGDGHVQMQIQQSVALLCLASSALEIALDILTRHTRTQDWQ